MTLYWFSAKLRFVCLIEGHGATRYMDSVFIFQATDFQPAFEKVLKLGRTREEQYSNEAKEIVAWRLAFVISLDRLGSELSDGAEIYSEPVPLQAGESIPFDAVFEPENSRPTQTV